MDRKKVTKTTKRLNQLLDSAQEPLAQEIQQLTISLQAEEIQQPDMDRALAIIADANAQAREENDAVALLLL